MTMTSHLVRRALPGDAAVLSQLNADVHAVHATGLPGRFKPPNAETFPPSLVKDLIAKPETLMFLGTLGDRPAGYLYAEIMPMPATAVRYAAPMVYIHHVSVRPDARGFGLGKALLGAVQTAAADHGITRLGLDVWTFNAAARSFFASQGFATVREVLYRG
jgi:ribosomal protein S18 acetylase RimI-like enzyme